jgi:hypothetical protein
MVFRMFRKGPAVAFSIFALALSACSFGERSHASKAIAAFLAAAQRGDKAAFEKGLDRSAVRADLRQQIADLGRARGVDVGGASEFALDRLITPSAVLAVAAGVKPGWPAAPTSDEIIPRMKVRDAIHVCLESAATKQCLLTFSNHNGAWRLVGMQAQHLGSPPPSVPGT